jgi:uncharacterized membrane protein
MEMSLFVKKILSKEEMHAISSEIGELEKQTSGEIRVVLRHHRHLSERKLSLYELALREFYRLGMQNTQHRTGVLMFFLISERKFQIIADEGIHSRVETGTWDNVAANMSSHFREKNFKKGVSEALQIVGNILAQHFPRTDAPANELPNDVVEE